MERHIRISSMWPDSSPVAGAQPSSSFVDGRAVARVQGWDTHRVSARLYPRYGGIQLNFFTDTVGYGWEILRIQWDTVERLYGYSKIQLCWTKAPLSVHCYSSAPYLGPGE